jgi:F-type H+-transporting ATPase subunit gamma
MAVEQLRDVRRRIGSVQSTKKITRAMELIATARIAKAQQRVEAARPYRMEITRVLAKLVADGPPEHALLRPPAEINRLGLVVITSDRGLVGPYNANVLRTAERHRKDASTLIVVGRKAWSYFRARGRQVDSAYAGMGESPTYADARRVTGEVMAAYQAQGLDAVYLVYTQFLSVATQRVVLHRLLPVERFDRPVEECARGPYELEPGEPAAILDRLLPRYVEAHLLAALLDASASEQAARQRAMKAATDNAEDLVKTLTRVANQARQSEITAEIMEIVGGAEALRRSAGNGKG